MSNVTFVAEWMNTVNTINTRIDLLWFRSRRNSHNKIPTV